MNAVVWLLAACLIVAAPCWAQEAPAPAAPAAAAPAGQGASAAPGQESAWIGSAPPSAEELAADSGKFEGLLADNGLALDVAGHSVLARGGTLHDKTSLAYPIEYVVVNERGRTHEALFMIKAQPSLLDACLRAAGLKPGTGMRFRPRVPAPTEAEMNAGASPWDPVPSSGPLVDVAVSWTDDAGAQHRRSLESMLLDVRNGKPLPEVDWVYTGSRLGNMRQGKKVVQTFLADIEGDIIALYLTGEGDCLLERNSLDGVDDTLYTINADNMPPRGTPVTITFSATGRNVAPAPPPADAVVVKGELGHKLDSYLTEQAGRGFAGVVLVERGDDVVLHKGYGLADSDAATPVTTATVFPLGGVGELFIDAAIFQLEDANKLKRDDVLARYLPDVPGDKAGITLRQLLDHTSGLSLPAGADTVDRATALAALLAAPVAAPAATPPSARTDEARAADDALLIVVVENVSSETWRDYLAEHVFGPAGMAQSGLFGEPHWDRAQLARGILPTVRPPGATETKAQDELPALKPPTWAALGRGAVAAPVGDFYRWERALREGRIVSDPRAAELLGDASEGLRGNWSVAGPDRIVWGAVPGFTAQYVRCATDPPARVMVFATGDGNSVGGVMGAALVSMIRAAAPEPAAAPPTGGDPHDGH